MKVYSEEQVKESLFNKGGTLVNEGIEIQKLRKNGKEVYFHYKGKNFCLTENNVIAKYSLISGKKYFQYGVLEFESYKEYNEVLETLKDYLER